MKRTTQTILFSTLLTISGLAGAQDFAVSISPDGTCSVSSDGITLPGELVSQETKPPTIDKDALKQQLADAIARLNELLESKKQLEGEIAAEELILASIRKQLAALPKENLTPEQQAAKNALESAEAISVAKLTKMNRELTARDAAIKTLQTKIAELQEKIDPKGLPGGIGSLPTTSPSITCVVGASATSVESQELLAAPTTSMSQ